MLWYRMEEEQQEVEEDGKNLAKAVKVMRRRTAGIVER